MTAARWLVALAGLLGFSGVLLAALGSHAVPGMEVEANYRSWQSASVIHLTHAAALAALGFRLQAVPSRWLAAASGLMFVGVILFSGSIYARVSFDLERTFNLAPMGGLLLMLAWLMVPYGLRRL